jgi:SAM-dependent methyltransferase
MCGAMAKEHFFYAETPKLFKKLEALSRRSGVSRGQAFEDWLTAMVCALAAETKEEEYLAMVERHKQGKTGERGIDLISEMFGELVYAMSETDADLLGDLFEGAITYGENGQFLTPESLASFMARLSVDADARPTADAPRLVNDACCGTGRMLLEAAKINPHVELVGQDIDPRCVKITAINLGLRSRYGWVTCGNTLTDKTQFAYRVGSFYHETHNGVRRGVIREVPIEQTPVAAIAEEVRDAAGKAIGEQGDTDGTSLFTLPAIIEVPRWLARLEPGLAALKQSDRPVNEVGEKPQDEQVPEGEQKQQTLF